MIPKSTTSRLRLLIVTAAVIAVVTTLATPAAAQDEAEQQRIVVQLEDPTAIGRLLTDYEIRIASPLVPSRHIYVVAPQVPLEKSSDTKKLAKELAKDDDVTWAEVESSEGSPEDDRFHAWPEGYPSDRRNDPEAWLAQPGIGFLQLETVHRRSTGAGVTVAVLDTGVDMDHPHLADHLAADGHYDFLDDDDDPSEELDGVDDDNNGHVDESYGHGTHAAGLVALIAPDAEIVSYRVLNSDGTGNPYLVGLAVHEAIDAGADVINISFGMDKSPKSKFLKEAFKRAKKNDVIVVAAVGNNGGKYKRFPASQKDVIGVAAAGRGNRMLARFSNFGKPALVAAPGEDMVSTLPGGGFGAWSGTSMAAPVVSGQAALIRERHPEAKLKKVAERVGKSSSKMEGKNRADKGLINILGSLDD